jgi:hypothetical protein
MTCFPCWQVVEPQCVSLVGAGTFGHVAPVLVSPDVQESLSVAYFSKVFGMAEAFFKRGEHGETVRCPGSIFLDLNKKSD